MTEDQFTNEEVEMLKKSTILELAMCLEDRLIHSGTLPEDLSVYEFLKKYFNK